MLSVMVGFAFAIGACALATGARFRISLKMLADLPGIARDSKDEHLVSLARALRMTGAELQSGAPTHLALESGFSAAEFAPTTRRVLRSSVSDDSQIVSALKQDSMNLPELAQLTAILQVAHSAGAGLAQAISRFADDIDESIETRLEVKAETSSALATARVLMLLPAFGLILGMGIGADPLGWLLGGPAGLAVLALALLLQGFGFVWTRRMIQAAT